MEENCAECKRPLPSAGWLPAQSKDSRLPLCWQCFGDQPWPTVRAPTIGEAISEIDCDPSAQSNEFKSTPHAEYFVGKVIVQLGASQQQIMQRELSELVEQSAPCANCSWDRPFVFDQGRCCACGLPNSGWIAKAQEPLSLFMAFSMAVFGTVIYSPRIEQAVAQHFVPKGVDGNQATIIKRKVSLKKCLAFLSTSFSVVIAVLSPDRRLLALITPTTEEAGQPAAVRLILTDELSPEKPLSPAAAIWIVSWLTLSDQELIPDSSQVDDDVNLAEPTKPAEEPLSLPKVEPQAWRRERTKKNTLFSDPRVCGWRNQHANSRRKPLPMPEDWARPAFDQDKTKADRQSEEEKPPLEWLSYPTLGIGCGCFDLLKATLTTAQLFKAKIRLILSVALCVLLIALGVTYQVVAETSMDLCCFTDDIEQCFLQPSDFLSANRSVWNNETVSEHCNKNLCFPDGVVGAKALHAARWGSESRPGSSLVSALGCPVSIVVASSVLLVLALLSSCLVTRAVALRLDHGRFWKFVWVLQLLVALFVLALATCLWIYTIFYNQRVIECGDMQDDSARNFCTGSFELCNLKPAVFLFGRTDSTRRQRELIALSLAIGLAGVVLTVVSSIWPFPNEEDYQSLQPAVPSTLIFHPGPYVPEGLQDESEIYQLQSRYWDELQQVRQGASLKSTSPKVIADVCPRPQAGAEPVFSPTVINRTADRQPPTEFAADMIPVASVFGPDAALSLDRRGSIDAEAEGVIEEVAGHVLQRHAHGDTEPEPLNRDRLVKRWLSPNPATFDHIDNIVQRIHPHTAYVDLHASSVPDGTLETRDTALSQLDSA